jgi:hypothetical protein
VVIVVSKSSVNGRLRLMKAYKIKHKVIEVTITDCCYRTLGGGGIDRVVLAVRGSRDKTPKKKRDKVNR